MGLGGRDREDVTGRMGLGGRDWEDSTGRTGLGGRDREDSGIMYTTYGLLPCL